MSELYHHGIKGMKWGVRRFQNPDGTLTPAGIKRYAIKGYSKDAYNANKHVAGKVYDRVTDAHKYSGQYKYAKSSDSENEKRAKKYLKEKNKAKRQRGRRIENGVAYTRKYLNSDYHKAGAKAATRVGTSFVLGSYMLGLPINKKWTAATSATAYGIGVGGQAIMNAIDKM